MTTNTIAKHVTKAVTQGHKKFGPIGQRRPEEEEQSGGDAGSAIKGHPFFFGLPAGMGADSNMSSTNSNPDMEKEAQLRGPELNPSLQNKLAAKLGHSLTPTPKATPY